MGSVRNESPGQISITVMIGAQALNMAQIVTSPNFILDLVILAIVWIYWPSHNKADEIVPMLVPHYNLSLSALSLFLSLFHALSLSLSLSLSLILSLFLFLSFSFCISYSF